MDRDRKLPALSPDGRLSVETTILADSAEPITVHMRRSPSLFGRLLDEQGRAVAEASSSVTYGLEDSPAIPLARIPAKTDADGHFRVDGLFPVHPVTIEFYRAGHQPWEQKHYRPEALRKVVLGDGQTRDVGTVRAKSAAW